MLKEELDLPPADETTALSTRMRKQLGGMD
jgi:hypothetical protein